MREPQTPRAPAGHRSSPAATAAHAWRDVAALGGTLALALAFGAVEPPLAITLAGLRLARVLAGDGDAGRAAAGWESTLRGLLP